MDIRSQEPKNASEKPAKAGAWGPPVPKIASSHSSMAGDGTNGRVGKGLWPPPPWLLAVACILFITIIYIATRPSQARIGNNPFANRSGAQSSEGATPVSGDAVPSTSGDLTFFVDAGLYQNELPALYQDLEAALAYVKKRGAFDKEPLTPFRVALVNDSSCALHGLAEIQQRTVQVFTCNDIPRSQAVAILAHEFVHQLAADRYGAAEQQADGMLAEGLATSAAGKYWLGDFPDFRSYVRAQRDAGTFYPLRSRVSERQSEMTDALYYEWASFVDFLIDTKGRDTFDQLYRSGRNANDSADFKGIYGLEFAQLEAEWQKWLDK